MKLEEYLTGKVPRYQNKMITTKKMPKQFSVITQVKNKTFELNCAKISEEINFEFTSPGTPQ